MTDEGNDLAFLYLDADDVVALDADIFECTVDEAGDQLRSRSGLEGAVARPHTHAAYGRADLALQAAVLAHGIAESQVFIDGNKRAALDGTQLAVVYQSPSAAKIDLVSLGTLTVTTSVSLPNGASAPSFISSIANGNFAVVLGGAGFFQLGLVSPTGGNPMWQTYQGNADSAAAG